MQRFLETENVDLWDVNYAMGQEAGNIASSFSLSAGDRSSCAVINRVREDVEIRVEMTDGRHDSISFYFFHFSLMPTDGLYNAYIRFSVRFDDRG